MRLVRLAAGIAILFESEGEATAFLKMYLRTHDGKETMARLERLMTKEMT